jgi:hypothetical protein
MRKRASWCGKRLRTSTAERAEYRRKERRQKKIMRMMAGPSSCGRLATAC